MSECLAFVAVFNLSSEDYASVEKIKKTINSAISLVGEIEATEENMIFSFPKDPSVGFSPRIPIFVKVEFLKTDIFSPPQNHIIANQIRDGLKSFFGEKKIDVIVKTDNSGGINISYSPRG